MGQNLSRNEDQGKGKSVEGLVNGEDGGGGAVGAEGYREGYSYSSKNGSSRSIGKTKKTATATTTKAAIDKTTTTFQTEESAAKSAASQQQRLKQTSTWSLGSLSGRLNWSFSGSSKNSFRNRTKSTRKSLTSLQQLQQQQQQRENLRRSKTLWHKPLTNAIFKSHFKESSRNEEFYIDRLIAKGAFGVVFKVIDKRTPPTQSHLPIPIPTAEERSKNTLSPSPAPSAATNNIIKTEKETETQTITTITATNSVAYALKVLKKSKVIEDNSVQQIKDEADIQKICGHHPFIVQQIDLWQNRHNLHILSEYIPNGELFEKIAHFSIDLVRLYLAEIALAIDFLHNAGIIYRDAKPENILLTANYHIKLIDFGLSKWLKLGTTTKTMCGTFQYMAPEILRGQAYGHAVDWWSLGVIVCQMMTNRAPDVRKFLQISLPPELMTAVDLTDNAISNYISLNKNSSLESLPLKSENYLPPEIESLPHESKDVICRLLIIEPKQRIRSVMALQRIAMYKNFKIDAKYLLSIRPMDILQQDNIPLLSNQECLEASSLLATRAFKDF